jgi:hypothetical protein
MAVTDHLVATPWQVVTIDFLMYAHQEVLVDHANRPDEIILPSQPGGLEISPSPPSITFALSRGVEERPRAKEAGRKVRKPFRRGFGRGGDG